MIDPNIFRAYDIRGIHGETLTEGIAEKIGRALVERFPEKSFLIGNDIRTSGPDLAKALTKGLENKGAEVTYIGTAAFGETLHAGTKNEDGVTIFLTASHLPPEWNGIKMYHQDGQGIEPHEIKNIVLNGQKEHTYEYIKFLKEKFNITKPLKVVIDCGNGSTCLTAPKVFKELGFETILLHDNIDPTFPARTADIKPKDLTVLKEKVLSENADFGVAFDGDGDRFLLVDEKGEMWRSDKAGLMLSKNMLPTSEKKNIIITLPVSMAAETQLKPLGGNIIRVPVGHIAIINGCKEHNALIGMEESGHVVLTDYFLFDDALVPPLKTAEIMCQTQKKLSELMVEIPNYPFDEITFECSDNLKFKFVEKLAEKFKQEYENVTTFDGVRIDFGNSWILIRAANTSPKVRLYLESTDQEKFNELKEKFTKIIEDELK